MKKAYFLASMLAVGALCSCSNDTEVISGVPQGGNNANDDLQPIVLSLGAPSISVRGTGTVGDLSTETATNVWSGQTLHLVMMNQDDTDWKPTTWFYDDGLGTGEGDNVDGQNEIMNFNHLQVTATTKENNIATLEWTDDSGDPTKDLKYYPTDGTCHDFFAYRIDDAAATYTAGTTGLDGDWASVDISTDGYPTVYDANGVAFFDDMATGQKAATAAAAGNKQYVYFKIDGSQDLMAGKAVKGGDGAGTWDQPVFSNKSARGQVVPNIVMKHLLTRFTFQVKGGAASAANLKVTGIEVESKTEGRMCVAYYDGTSEADDVLTAEFSDDVTAVDEGGTNKVFLALKERNGDANAELIALSEKQLEYNEDPADDDDKIGEALLVAPGEQTYNLKVYVTETLSDGTSTSKNIQEGIITIPQSGTAAAGTSYNILITLYGSEPIKVEATLTGWENGTTDGPITVTPGE